MKLAVVIMTVSSFAFVGCGYQFRSGSIPAAAEVRLPAFESEGKSYFLSTECSPHSQTVELRLEPDRLEVSGILSYGTSKYYTLDYSTLRITARTQEFFGSTPISLFSRWDKATDAALYTTALGDLVGLVEKVRKGNICFAARPELADVVDYLKSL